MKKVLTIGPDYKKLGGGVVSVLSTYSKYDDKFEFLPTFSSENNLLNIIVFPYYLLKIFIFLLNNKDIEIIHIHGSSYISFYRKYLIFLICKYLFNKKVIFHIHGAEFHLFYKKGNFITKKFIKHFIESSKAIIVLSKFWKEFFQSNFNQKNIFILNNTIPYPLKFTKEEKQTINFLFLGEIGTRKGTFELIEAINLIKNQLINKSKFYIGGDGSIDKLKSKIKEYQLENIVFFKGWVVSEQKISLLTKSDVYILPSHNEGLPISILEAMSYAMPIISTPVGGIPEVVKNNENGFLVKPGNIQEIKESILFFISNKNKIQEMGKVSSELVKEYLPEKVILNLHGIYKQL